ncbi:MAG: hypothetical protein CVT92_02555 [Bacteroidetes bacterium HGW-Bacteroidetes-1]|jgi:hypothetical protein|nr:MAG: hypothetical protein CVT92_02555 [Bacteroidetes bacterium HGW-Bacteroidetes-1]
MSSKKEVLQPKPKVLDSGKRQEFSTGSRRDIQEGKGLPSLLQLIAIMEVAKVCEAGAEKYGRENWRKGQPLSRYFDSAIRHMFKFALNWKDEPHLPQAIWNLMCLIETKSMITMGLLPKELDDLPNEFFQNDDMANLMKTMLGYS